jgi:hypothetical protein
MGQRQALSYLSIGALALVACAHPASVASPTNTPVRVRDVLLPREEGQYDVVPPEQFVPDVPLIEGEFTCGRRELLVQHLHAVTATYPSPNGTPAVVVVLRDSLGKMVSYSERRGAPIRPSLPPSAGQAETGAAVKAAADSARSTVVTISFPTRRAMVENRGGGGPTVRAEGSIQTIGRLESLGKPLERAERISASCGVR